MNWQSKYLEVYEQPYQHSYQQRFRELSTVINRINSHPNPLLSVIIIASNEERRLLACIWSICSNICPFPFEIIGVDNGSTDHTAEIYQQCGVRYVYEERRGHGYARNRGQEIARGTYCICIDSDTIYPPGYLSRVAEELQKPGVIATTGFYDFITPNWSEKAFLFFYKYIRMLHYKMLMKKRPELVARGMVLAYKRELGIKKGFRTGIARGEDGGMIIDIKQYGKINLILDSRAHVLTSMRSLKGDGSLWKSLYIRGKKYFSKLYLYFQSQENYEDR